MAELTNLIEDVEGTIARRSEPARERTLSKITDLLVRDAERLGDEELALFDNVLGCFTSTVAVDAKATLAGRLADLPNAPLNVTRTLAFDEEIVVSGPILARSQRLEDQDLIEVAAVRGSSHMLAICERRSVSEPVTDVLVAKGNDNVWRAITANDGARFSELGKAELLDRSKEDETLQDLLGARHDLTDGDMNQLVAIAREAARARIVQSLEPVRPAAPQAPAKPAGFDYPGAQKVLRQITERRPVSEADIAAFARKDQGAETIAAVSLLAALPIPVVERVFRQRDDHLLLVIARANNWSWRTVRALLGLRDPLLPDPSARSAEPAFEAIRPAEARRCLATLSSGKPVPPLGRMALPRPTSGER